MRSLFALSVVALLVVGCADMTTAPAPVALPNEPRAVLPQWRAFALDHYREAVRYELKSPSTARFIGEPRITAEFNPNTNMTVLSLYTELDAQNPFGGLMRSGAFVVWQARGDVAATGGDFVSVWAPSAIVWTRQ